MENRNLGNRKSKKDKLAGEIPAFLFTLRYKLLLCIYNWVYIKYILIRGAELLMGVNSISAFSASYNYIDSEHKRIMEELRALGIEPTGNKSTDKMKLQQAKEAQKKSDVKETEFVKEVQEAAKPQSESSGDDAAKEISAKNMTGAAQIADYNKYKLLGIY